MLRARRDFSYSLSERGKRGFRPNTTYASADGIYACNKRRAEIACLGTLSPVRRARPKNPDRVAPINGGRRYGLSADSRGLRNARPSWKTRSPMGGSPLLPLRFRDATRAAKVVEDKERAARYPRSLDTRVISRRFCCAIARIPFTWRDRRRRTRRRASERAMDVESSARALRLPLTGGRRGGAPTSRRRCPGEPH